jgi:hypothetical protein
MFFSTYICTLKKTIVYYNAGAVLVNSEVVGLTPGPNPTIVSYNATAVKIYNATSSLVRFENKNIFCSRLRLAL